MSWNSSLPVTPQRRQIKHSPRSLSANIGENTHESSSEDQVDQPPTPKNAGPPRGEFQIVLIFVSDTRDLVLPSKIVRLGVRCFHLFFVICDP